MKKYISSFTYHLSSRKGFTLVELLIAIAVIGVLAGGIVSIINPSAQFQKANDARRKTDLSQIEKALETFYQDNGKYPDAVDNKIKRLDGITADWGEQWTPYMENLPKDPSSSRKYAYCTSDSGQSYYLYASLERDENNSLNFTTGCSVSSCEVISGFGVECNYGVSSPNVSP